MNFQLLPCPAQNHHDIVIRQAVPLGDFCHRLGEEVAAHEHIAVPLRQRTDEHPNALAKLSGLVFALHIRFTGKALRQLIQDADDNLCDTTLQIWGVYGKIEKRL